MDGSRCHVASRYRHVDRRPQRPPALPPTETFDYAEGKLVSTGTRYFSGTVLGSAPVILYDNRFPFEVDFETGATIGKVYLGRSLDSPPEVPWHDCTLDIVGTGLTP